MGRKRDPNHIRALKGKKPRLAIEHQVTFPVVATTVTVMAPDYLNEEATHHWERMALLLAEAGMLQEVGRDKLARYCQAAADYEEVMIARNKLGAKKLEVTEVNWRKFVHWQKMLQMADALMKDFEQEYGLTPASACRIRRPGAGKGQSPQEKFQEYLDEIPKVN